MRVRLIALSVLAGILIPASGALAAEQGGIGIRLVDAPGKTRDGRRARSYIVERLAPGTSIQRRVEISNGTRLAVDVAVYPAAASLRRGEFGFASGRSRNELSSWTSGGRDLLRLAPGARAIETLTINVPDDASSGERYAVVWAAVSAPSPEAGGVTLVNRVGVRMYVTVGPGGAPPSNFAIGSLRGKRSPSGEPLVVARVRNSGGRTLDISGALTLSKGPGGIRAGPFPVRAVTGLAPGRVETIAVRLDEQLPRGPWRVRLRLTGGSVERGAVATITFPGHLNSARASDVPTGSDRLILGLIGVLLVLVVAAVALLLSRRVRRSRRRDPLVAGTA